MIRFTKLVAPFGFAIVTMLAFAGEAQACPECDMLPTPAQRAACVCPEAQPVQSTPDDSGTKKRRDKKRRDKKDDCEAGTENCPCFPNDSCNDPLECVQKGDEKVCLQPCTEPQVRDESGNCSEPKCEPAPRNICDRDVAHKDLEDRVYRMELTLTGDPNKADDKGLVGKVDNLGTKVDGLNTTVTNGFGSADRYWWMHFVNGGLILLFGILMLVRTRRKEDDEPQPPDGEKAPSGGGQGGGQELPTPPGQTPQEPSAPAPQAPPAQGLPQNIPPLPQAGASPAEQPAPPEQAPPSNVPHPAPPPSQPPPPEGSAEPAVPKGTMVGVPGSQAVN